MSQYWVANNTNVVSKEKNNISPMVHCFLTDYKKLVTGSVQIAKLVTILENWKCEPQIVQQIWKFRHNSQLGEVTDLGSISATHSSPV